MSAPPVQAPKYVKVSSIARTKKFRPRPIGYRGRHDHGKPLDDPVYPTKHLPWELRQKNAPDWRSGGRAMLVAGLAKVKNIVKGSPLNMVNL